MSRNSIAPKALPPEVPEPEEKKLRNAAGVIPFAALVLHESEKRSGGRSDDERISSRAAELEQRARRELNPDLRIRSYSFQPFQGFTDTRSRNQKFCCISAA